MEKKRVMLVEDEELIREGLKNIIDWEQLGLTVVYSAANGEEALSLLEEKYADIVITDISMPVMDGLTFLKKLREKDRRCRCIILTGYEEFEYARTAIKLDVEEYILKPIDEEKLEQVLNRAKKQLEEMDEKSSFDMDEKTGWLQLLKGSLSPEEAAKYFAALPEIKEGITIYPAIMKISLESLHGLRLSDLLSELHSKAQSIRMIYLAQDTLFLLYFTKNMGETEAGEYLEEIQGQIESRLGVLTFISMGTNIRSYQNLIASYAVAKKQQKYQLVEGYGSCITPWQMQNRQSKDIEIDEACLRKLILKKEKEGGLQYIEELFLNQVSENSTVDDIYQMSLKIAMVLSEIKKEYKLSERKNMCNLTELVESIYHAEDIAALKAIFCNEIAEIISCLNENDSQFTPVIKQIMAEVQKNYGEDMNLKTLSYKYHMNASYLGQVFQKEVGCSFAQYISNIKNSKAKELILNTNLKINDIAKEVGYTDTSYFYRKFKQCYGVSPAALREMKKY